MKKIKKLRDGVRGKVKILEHHLVELEKRLKKAKIIAKSKTNDEVDCWYKSDFLEEEIERLEIRLNEVMLFLDSFEILYNEIDEGDEDEDEME
jgi:BMFP domain-containing protein YqiC